MSAAPSSSFMSSPGGAGRRMNGGGGPSRAAPSSSMDVESEADYEGARQQQQQQQQPNGDAARANGNGDARRRDDEAVEEGEGGARGGNRRRPRAFRDVDDIPRVKDETGERVKESFEEFLEKCVLASAAALAGSLCLPKLTLTHGPERVPVDTSATSRRKELSHRPGAAARARQAATMLGTSASTLIRLSE